MGERLSSAGIGERVGVSRQRIDELAKEGRLTKDADGKIDVDEADALWASMDPAYLQRKASAQAARQADETAAEPKQEAHAVLYNKARANKAAIEAQNARLSYEIKAGKYVLREEVKRGGFKIGKLVSSRLNNAANQLAPQLVAIKDVKSAHEIVHAYMTQLATDVRNELASLG